MRNVSARIVSISGKRQGTYVLLEAALPERAPRTIGVFLLDPEAGRGWIRLREHFEDCAEPEDAEVLALLAEDLPRLVAEMGGAGWLAAMEDSLSNVLRLGERLEVSVDAFTRVLEQLYAEHVEPVSVRPFQSHLPLYSLRAAAGRLGDEMASEEEDWVRAPEGMRLSPDMFVAHVTGRSMEPRIPDGSLNLFRLNPVGSRQNKILLIQRFGVLDETARYTVKKYTSRKAQNPDGSWYHKEIRLEPLNPEFEAWVLTPDDFAVVAEWVCVLE
jgi:SOS-response transcriptional repressor LexA